MDPNNPYTIMQQNQYDNDASYWNVNDKDIVVGSFDLHNNWSDYNDFLFKNIITAGKIGLDFGCGPGRNIVKFSNSFERIDGVDISNINLQNAQTWINYNNILKSSNLIKSNGVDLSSINDNIYDIVFSTICLQHICVHDIRYNLMQEFFRVLKPGGNICIQMGYGSGNPRTSSYFDNYYDCEGTNGFFDVRIDSISDLQTDIENIGFINFDYDIRPVGPGDNHGNWIFFRAQKPQI